MTKRRLLRSEGGVVAPDGGVSHASADDQVPVALIGCDVSGRIISWNRAASALLGWRAHEVVGRRVIDIFGRDLMVGVGSDRMRTKAMTSYGSTVDVEVVTDTHHASGHPAGDPMGDTVFVALPTPRVDAGSAGEASPRINSWAEAAAAIQQIGGTVQCLAIGLIGVRAVNRGYSRSTGDAVLRDVMARLGHVAGPDGRALRIGGTQFLVATPASRTLDGEQVIHELAAPIETKLGAIRLAACVGTGVGESVSAYVLLDQADAALRRATTRGVGAVERTPQGASMHDSRHPRLSSLLIDAVARREIGVQFQPVVDVTTGDIVSFEALARWTSAELGEVDPSLFIEAAEDAGLIHELGRCVLDVVLDTVLAERVAGRWGERRASINLSAVQLAHPDLLNRVTGALARRSLTPAMLQIELTETRPVPADGPAALHLRALRQLGVRIAVDDFGVGCANLSYLRDLPVDAIKIDRRFVAGVSTSRADAAVVRSIISVADELDIDVIAEGVETADQHLALVRLGCTAAQGFLYASPRSADDLHGQIVLPVFVRSSSIPYPFDEDGRIEALHATEVLDTAPEPPYDDIVRRAADLCDAPTSLLALIDVDRQWVKARVGSGPDQVDRAVSLCAHAICGDGLMEVPDARDDARFRDNPIVAEAPGVRFYAGVPLKNSAGHNYGTLCVMDVVPRTLSAEQRAGLTRLAERAATLLELRQQSNQTRRATTQLQLMADERDAARHELAHLTDHDQLTGLPNRQALMPALDAALSVGVHDGCVALLICDYDRFRLINDALGHVAGDQCLHEVARRICASVRSSEMVARIGGNEFAVVVPRGDQFAIEALTGRIIDRMTQPLTAHGADRIVPSVSIGIAMGRTGMRADYLLRDASDALRQAKAMGGGRVCQFGSATPPPSP